MHWNLISQLSLETSPVWIPLICEEDSRLSAVHCINLILLSRFLCCGLLPASSNFINLSSHFSLPLLPFYLSVVLSVFCIDIADFSSHFYSELSSTDDCQMQFLVRELLCCSCRSQASSIRGPNRQGFVLFLFLPEDV
jgi:hypothetical protein